MDLTQLKDLAPIVSLALVLGFFHYKAVQTVTDANSKTIALLGQSHEAKTVAFLDETKKKDDMIMNLVTNHLNRTNEVMEKWTVSNEKLIIAIDGLTK